MLTNYLFVFGLTEMVHAGERLFLTAFTVNHPIPKTKITSNVLESCKLSVLIFSYFLK